MEILTTLMGGTILSSAGGLAALVAIITEILKNILPKSFPTKALTIIVSFLVVFGFTALTAEFTIPVIIGSIFSSFVIGFISMFGFDTFKELLNRFKINDEGDDTNDRTS